MAALAEDAHKYGTATGAIQRLVELYKESRNRPGTIASRLGLDVEICLNTVPSQHQAVSQNNGALISAIIPELEQHSDLVVDFFGRTVVHYAVERHGVGSLRCLFQGGRYLDNQDYIGRTALQIAEAQGDKKIVQLLHSNRAGSIGYGRTLPQAAAGGRSLETMKPLHSSNTDADPYRCGIQALHAAASSGRLGVVKLLLFNGVEVNSPAHTYIGRKEGRKEGRLGGLCRQRG